MDDSKKETTEKVAPAADSPELDTLEGSSTVVSDSTTSTTKPAEDKAKTDPQSPKKVKTESQPIFQRFGNFSKRANLYLLLFIFVLVIAGITIFVAIYRQKKVAAPATVSNQKLSQTSLSQVAGSNTAVGSSNQLLTIQSASVFNGQVTIKNNLSVTGNLQVGQTLTIPSLNVAGTGSFNQLQSTNLTVSGTSTFQGPLVAQKGISVSGPVSFGGTLTAPQLNVNTLDINGDLAINHHITTNGSVPRVTSQGGALSSVSGTDTAGTVTMNLASAGGNTCYANVTFAQSFSTTPHVIISPDSYGAASIAYYASNISSTGFSICNFTSSAPGAVQAVFGYIVVD